MSEHSVTESTNPASEDLDLLSTIELVRLINAEDEKIAGAVASQAEVIAQAIDLIASKLEAGGRLILMGAGTSGRLGVLDAAECAPTFNADPEQVIGLIAGGDAAILKAVEGAEDSTSFGAHDLASIGLNRDDVVVGIAASGRTPYVIGALDYARSRGAVAIGFSCNSDAAIADHADLMITVVVGPEVLTGSTRMKAGTATKMVLNMLTTGAMIRLGKAYGNLMVDVQATNEKLVARTVRIVRRITGLPENAAIELLDRCNGELKTVIVSHKLGMDADDARAKLARSGGKLREALGECP
jgi:N-acetylmuramic acid 6-phosphate etherase